MDSSITIDNTDTNDDTLHKDNPFIEKRITSSGSHISNPLHGVIRVMVIDYQKKQRELFWWWCCWFSSHTPGSKFFNSNDDNSNSKDNNNKDPITTVTKEGSTTPLYKIIVSGCPVTTSWIVQPLLTFCKSKSWHGWSRTRSSNLLGNNKNDNQIITW